MFLFSTSRPNPQRPHGSIAMAGLLTCRLITNTFPSFYLLSGICLCLQWRLTAAGLFRSFTWFPINR